MMWAPEIIMGNRCYTRLTLLDYESIVSLRAHISRVLGLML